MAKKHKRPGKGFNPGSSKKPRITPEAPQPFRWRADYADLSSQVWGWSRVAISEFFRHILKKLHQLEDSNWNELIGQDQVHFMSPSDIAREAQKRIEALTAEGIIPEDLTGEYLASLRFTGRARVWGYKVGKYFYMIWWDPDHTVYPVPKR